MWVDANAAVPMFTLGDAQARPASLLPRQKQLRLDLETRAVSMGPGWCGAEPRPTLNLTPACMVWLVFFFLFRVTVRCPQCSRPLRVGEPVVHIGRFDVRVLAVAASSRAG